MLSVLGFLIILAPLVIVHEFGHYIFARIFNVKAEVFSVGFGPRIWSRMMGETELRLSAVPLGGYVKLLGEDREAPLSPADARRALHNQVAWKRFLIFFGGPLFNFIFSVMIFMAILVIGEPQTANVVGRVVEHSAAQKAGFVSGDRILSVNGQPVTRFEQIATVISQSPEKEMSFVVERGGAAAPLNLKAVPSSQLGFSMYGEATHVGEIDGFLPMGRGTKAGISNPKSAAGLAGIASGDDVIAFGNTPVESWEQLEALYEKVAPGTAIALKIRKADGGAEKTITLTKPAATAAGEGMGAAWGLYSSELFVEKSLPKSPAAEAGVTHGDRLVSIGGQNVYSFNELRESVQKSGEKTGKVHLIWERDGQLIDKTIDPTATQSRDPAMKVITQYTIGVTPILSLAEPVTVIERVWNPFMLVWKGTERMVSFTWRNLVSVAKMFSGDVSVGTLGGPILIGKIAGESLSHGLITFLSTMSILSIGLGVLNLFPVPVLDGGHILLLGVESVRGRPLSLRQMEIVQGFGLFLILALMAVVLKNDITRLGSF